MTIEELHRRILYYELREILLDQRRLGDRVPDVWRKNLRDMRDEKIGYLLLADWFEKESKSSRLAELIHIQIELMEEIPPDYQSTDFPGPWSHPFEWDAEVFCDGRGGDLTKRRWEIVGEFYRESAIVQMVTCSIPEIEILRHRGDRLRDFLANRLYDHGFDLDKEIHSEIDHHNRVKRFWQEQHQKRGITSRMLTNLMRYMHAEKNKTILVLHAKEGILDHEFRRMIAQILPGNDLASTFSNNNNLHMENKLNRKRIDLLLTDHRYTPPEPEAKPVDPFAEGLEDPKEETETIPPGMPAEAWRIMKVLKKPRRSLK